MLWGMFKLCRNYEWEVHNLAEVITFKCEPGGKLGGPQSIMDVFLSVVPLLLNLLHHAGPRKSLGCETSLCSSRSCAALLSLPRPV
ncbi:hypothetical protein CapIbe_012566 [Capra ibex]